MQPCAVHGRAAAFLPVSMSHYDDTRHDLNVSNKVELEELEEKVIKMNNFWNLSLITKVIKRKINELHKLIRQEFEKCTEAQNKSIAKVGAQEFVRYYLIFMRYIWIALRLELDFENMTTKFEEVYAWQKDERIQDLLDMWRSNLLDSAYKILDPQFSRMIMYEK